MISYLIATVYTLQDKSLDTKLNFHTKYGVKIVHQRVIFLQNVFREVVDLFKGFIFSLDENSKKSFFYGLLKAPILVLLAQKTQMFDLKLGLERTYFEDLTKDCVLKKK